MKKITVILYLMIAEMLFSTGYSMHQAGDYSIHFSKDVLDEHDVNTFKKTRLKSFIKQVGESKELSCRSCNRVFVCEEAVTFFYRDFRDDVHKDGRCFLCTQEIATLAEDLEVFSEKFSMHPSCYKKICNNLEKITCSKCFLEQSSSKILRKERTCCGSCSTKCKNCCLGAGACMFFCCTGFFSCLCSKTFCEIFGCECCLDIFSAFTGRSR